MPGSIWASISGRPALARFIQFGTDSIYRGHDPAKIVDGIRGEAKLICCRKHRHELAVFAVDVDFGYEEAAIHSLGRLPLGFSCFTEGVWAKQLQELPSRRWNAVLSPLTDGRLLDVADACNLSSTAEGVDDFGIGVSGHGAMIGTPKEMSIGTPIIVGIRIA